MNSKITPYLFILPVLVIYAVFGLYPIFSSIYISLTEWDGINPIKWVGFKNYLKLWNDELWWIAIRNNMIWSLLYLAYPILLGLLVAVLLEAIGKGEKLFRTIIFFPQIMSMTVAGIIWSFMYDPDFGAVNMILKLIGLGNLARPWLGDPTFALYAIIFGAGWMWTGFCMVMFSAGLKNVPLELIEAAKVDGAGSWHVFRHITLPLLRAPLIVVVLMTLQGSLLVFDIVWVMTRGGPFYSTYIVALLMYESAFVHYKMGYGSAIAVVLTLIVLAIGYPYIKALGKRWMK
jgi:ABC-type sugar transport system permease subunit